MFSGHICHNKNQKSVDCLDIDNGVDVDIILHIIQSFLFGTLILPFVIIVSVDIIET